MYVKSVLDVLKISMLTPHEELLSTGRLREFTPEMVVIFISHQWLGRKHPDLHMKQFRVLQAGLAHLVAGTADLGVCFKSMAAGHSSEPSLRGEAARGLVNAFIWYDFFSVPQRFRPRRSGSHPELMTVEMRSAVLSIPAYVDRAQYFVALVPSVSHNDSPNLRCDRATWSARGWCRTEAWVAALSTSSEPKVCILLMEDQIMIEFLPLQWLFAPPHAGEFAIESDRSMLHELEVEVFDNHLEAVAKAGETCYARFLSAMRTHVNRAHGPQEDLDKWLLNFNFSDAHDVGEDGWGPLCYAALEGNTSVVQELVARGANVNRGTKAAAHQVMAEAGMTPLMLAAMYIWDEGKRASTCGTLLELSADPCSTDDKGNTALHLTASSAAGRETIQVLLYYGACVNAVNQADETPLFTSCFRNPTTSSEATPCIKSLLESGARLDIYNNLGWTALHIASFLGSAADIRLLLEAQADVNQRTIETSALLQQTTDCVTAWGTGGANKMMRDIFCELGAGTTPLMMTCILKNESGGLELLRHRADPTIKSDIGKTAVDIALVRGLAGDFMSRLIDAHAP